MKYTVLWRPIAEAAFLASMLRAADKPALWKIARAIDSLLATKALEAGESRETPWRLLFMRPYSVLYSIDEPNRTVHVEQIKWVGH